MGNLKEIEEVAKELSELTNDDFLALMMQIDQTKAMLSMMSAFVDTIDISHPFTLTLTDGVCAVNSVLKSVESKTLEISRKTVRLEKRLFDVL